MKIPGPARRRRRAGAALAIALLAWGPVAAIRTDAAAPETTLRYLALGDSYTIGEGVAPEERWPVLLARRLRDRGLVVAEPLILARTGWTIDELDAGIDAAPPPGRFDLVSLLIGVNDQYRGRATEDRRAAYRALLERAIGFAGGRPGRVIVLSIPDWGATPFAEGRDRAKIAAGIDRYNAMEREEAARAGVRTVDVTPVSRRAGAEPALLAADGLHPSAAMYAAWVELALPAAIEAIGGSGAIGAPSPPPDGAGTDPHAGHAAPAGPEADPAGGRAAALLSDFASGTSVHPAAAPMHMKHHLKGAWGLMFHGNVFVVGAAQGGPRGGDEVYSANWFMASGLRRAGRGALMLRAMLSLDPATVRDGFYPLLFQTGEEHEGVPIVDGQHPHDLFMELALAWAVPAGRRSTFYLYAAPIGDPALGPVAFPHRAGNAENPSAALGHHLQDSTHIASDVVTAGWDLGTIRFEASGFHGEEPDDGRWNIDQGGIDSWSGRLTWRPSPGFAAQLSRGRLEAPESHDPVDVTRTTASILYARPSARGGIAAGIVWGRNRSPGSPALGSYLAEGVWSAGRNHLFGRVERLDRNELFARDPVQEAIFEAAGIESFTVRAATLGFTRDLLDLGGWVLGLGADATAYAIPRLLQPFYGERPESYHLFLRFRPRHPAGQQTHPVSSVFGRESCCATGP